jgi:hypothetical protein
MLSRLLAHTPSPIQKKKSNILNTIYFEIEMYILKSLKNYKELEL